jgi:tryptophan-rich sensory protein
MTARRGSRSLLLLALLLAATLATGWLGGRVTMPAIGGWYAGLAKPGFTPPNWVFAPVWTTLYVAMAVAAWLAFGARGARGAADGARLLFWVQLALNLAWSCVFFGARDPGWAFATILLLDASVAATTLLFWRLDRRAGLLFLPYCAWIAYATALNLAIWRANLPA